jgi:hypothetical protein
VVNLNDPKKRTTRKKLVPAKQQSRRAFNVPHKARSGRSVEVTRHDTACAVLHGGQCGCAPESETIIYERVCAYCGGQLEDRRRPYCSASCRKDSGIRGKDLTARQNRDQEYRARASEP